MKKLILLLFISFSALTFAEETDLSSMNDVSSQESINEINGNENSEPITINFLNSKLTIENAPINSSVDIFSMIGVKVFHEIITESKQFFLVDLKKGYYIVKVGNTTKKLSVK